MNMLQLSQLGKLAKLHGYSVAVEKGKVQIQTIHYRKNGSSEITPHTGMIDFETAVRFLASGELK